MAPGQEARAGIPAVVEGLTVVRLLVHAAGGALIHRQTSQRRVETFARLLGQYLELGHRVTCEYLKVTRNWVIVLPVKIYGH